MPFSSLSNPAELARAQAVLDAAWSELEHRLPPSERAEARTQIAYLVARSLQSAIDEAELVRSIIEKFADRCGSGT